MLKKDKHGWIRILEAFLAIMIMLGFFLSIISKQSAQVSPQLLSDIYETERQMLKEASENSALRAAVIASPPDYVTIKSFFYPRIPSGFAFDTNVCQIFDTCKLKQPVTGNVYADDILISSTLYQAPPQPLILRLFMWPGETKLCVAGQKIITWSNYYADPAHVCADLAVCGHCQGIVECSADEKAFTTTKEAAVEEESGALCGDALDNDCDGAANDADPGCA